MEISVNDKLKIVEIWLANGEKESALCAELLKPLYAEYKIKKYIVAVFKSGTKDLAAATGDLLCYNKKRLAQLEVQSKKLEPSISESPKGAE